MVFLFAATPAFRKSALARMSPSDLEAVTPRPRIATLRRCLGAIALGRQAPGPTVPRHHRGALTKHKASDGPLTITFSLPQLFPWFRSLERFRPIAPRSPHLNGKVERTHRADREEFWDTVNSRAPDIETKLAEWQHHWNWHRPHTALGGLSPIDRVCERIDKTPLSETVEAAYDRTRERIRIADYRLDKALDELK